MSAAPAAVASTVNATAPANEYLNVIVIPFFPFRRKARESRIIVITDAMACARPSFGRGDIPLHHKAFICSPPVVAWQQISRSENGVMSVGVAGHARHSKKEAAVRRLKLSGFLSQAIRVRRKKRAASRRPP